MEPIIRAVLSNLLGEHEQEIAIISNDADVKPDGTWQIKYRHPTSGFGHDKSQAILPYRRLDDPPFLFFFGTAAASAGIGMGPTSSSESSMSPPPAAAGCGPTSSSPAPSRACLPNTDASSDLSDMSSWDEGRMKVRARRKALDRSRWPGRSGRKFNMV